MAKETEHGFWIDRSLGGTVALLLLLSFATKEITDLVFVATGATGTYLWAKNGFMFAACIAALPVLAHNDKPIGKDELKRFGVLFLFLALASVIQALACEHLSQKVVIELTKLVLAPVCAYCLINTANRKQIYKFMLLILVMTWAGYICELAIKGVSVSAILNADVVNSSSDTESSSFGGIAIALCLYFAFERSKRIPIILSLVLCILTFKRVQIAYGVIVFLLPIILPRILKGKPSKKLIALLMGATVIAELLWVWLLMPEQAGLFSSIFGKSQNAFTMGRSGILNYFFDSDFASYGFKSATEVALSIFGFALEMDCGEIFLEFGLVGLLVFSWSVWATASESKWGVVTMGYLVINCLFSRVLTGTWTVMLLLIVVSVASAMEKGLPGYAHEYRDGDT